MDLAQNWPTILKMSVTSLTNLLLQTESKQSLNSIYWTAANIAVLLKLWLAYFPWKTRHSGKLYVTHSITHSHLWYDLSKK